LAIAVSVEINVSSAKKARKIEGKVFIIAMVEV
jgi:hypothetical protein